MLYRVMTFCTTRSDILVFLVLNGSMAGGMMGQGGQSGEKPGHSFVEKPGAGINAGFRNFESNLSNASIKSLQLKVICLYGAQLN